MNVQKLCIKCYLITDHVRIENVKVEKDRVKELQEGKVVWRGSVFTHAFIVPSYRVRAQ